MIQNRTVDFVAVQGFLYAPVNCPIGVFWGNHLVVFVCKSNSKLYMMFVSIFRKV